MYVFRATTLKRERGKLRMNNTEFKQAFYNQFSETIKYVKHTMKVINGYVNGYGSFSYAEYVLAVQCLNSFNDIEMYAIKFIGNERSRSSRLKKRISDMIYKFGSSCCFLTITFNDDSLKFSTEDDRKKYVKEFLKLNCSCYVANIDYGDNKKYFDSLGIERVGTNREHYHAFVSNPVDFSTWLFGNVDSERLRYTNSAAPIAKYISKLTSHSLKNSVKFNRVIYSR